VLFVAYYASAELGCYRVLGWPMPERILDLFTEFRARTNGLNTPAGNGLLGALAYFGLDGMGATEKEDMRALILRGGPWSDAERLAILDYCEGDVDALRRLLVAMVSKVDLPRALLRGRYMAAAAAMEHAGTPIDTTMLELFRAYWTDPISPVTVISPLPSRPARCPMMPPRRRTAPNVNCSSSACSRSSTGWNGGHWRYGRPSPGSSRVIYCERTVKPTADSGNGPTLPLIRPCWWA